MIDGNVIIIVCMVVVGVLGFGLFVCLDSIVVIVFGMGI